MGIYCCYDRRRCVFSIYEFLPSQARSPNLQPQRASNTYVITALEFGWVQHDFAATIGGISTWHMDHKTKVKVTIK